MNPYFTTSVFKHFFFGISEIVGFRLMQPEYSPEPLLFLELIFKYFNCDESVRIVIYLLICNGNEVVHKLKLVDIFRAKLQDSI